MRRLQTVVAQTVTDIVPAHEAFIQMYFLARRLRRGAAFTPVVQS